MPQKRILVVEDDENIRLTLSQVLEAEGYEVLAAQNGQEGLNVLRTQAHPGLVLLDLMMPVMNGHEFLEEQMNDLFLFHLPVVVVSANASRSNSYGAADFLMKPMNLEDLLQVVEKHCA